MEGVRNVKGVRLPVLTPNLKVVTLFWKNKLLRHHNTVIEIFKCAT